MSLKSKELEINPDNPFSNCKLERKQYADILSQIVENYGDGFVMAINNRWGTGKTTFLKMWQRQLIINGFKTVYFNAWENDFEDNALTALIGELNTITTSETQPEFKDVIKKGAVLAKNILPTLVKAYVARHFEIKELEDFAQNATKGITEIFEQDVDQYNAKKTTINEFRANLEKFIKNSTDEKPLIFIIDELDRCRPNYAVSVLEQIKHFFSVSGIIFVLSIDKYQLGNAIKGVYNSDGIDAEEYLRRFIDIEYSIPEPEPELYLNYLYNKYDFNSFFKSPERIRYSELQDDSYRFLRTANFLFQKTSLRQQEKIFNHSRLALNSFAENVYVVPTLFIYLIYIRSLYFDFYQSIRDKSITIDELQETFLQTVGYNTLDNSFTQEVQTLEALLVYFYYNHYYTDARSFRKPIISNSENKDILAVNSKIEENSTTFIHTFKSLLYTLRETKISFFLKKIDLIEPLKIYS